MQRNILAYGKSPLQETTCSETLKIEHRNLKIQLTKPNQKKNLNKGGIYNKLVMVTQVKK